jgi:hypothetical protein
MTKSKTKSAPKKSASRKSKKKPLPVKKATKAKPAADHLAGRALKLVDEAAALLRSGIRQGAKTTAHSREVAKQKAHRLLGQASTSLSQAIEDGASSLQRILKKL